MVLKMRDIAAAVTPIAPFTTAQTALQRFHNDPELFAIPLVIEGAPAGLLTRAAITEPFTTVSDKHMVSRQKASAFCNETPSMIDANAPAAAAAAAAARSGSCGLVEGFVLVDQGHYAGYVRPDRLFAAVASENMKRAASMKAMREMRAREDEQAALAASEEQTLNARFLETLGHEIRTPLTAMIGLSDLLNQAKLPGPARGHAETIAACGGHMRRLLGDLIDYSQTKSSAFRLTNEHVELKAFAAEARALWEPNAAAKGLGFYIDIQPKSEKRFEADATRLRQILYSLIRHAVDNTAEGLVGVEIGTSLSDDGLGLTMKVIDTGSKVGRGRRRQALDGFCTDGESGASLGLAVAQKLSEKMDGGITLETAPGGGTVFVVNVRVKKAGPRLAYKEERKPKRNRGAFTLGKVLVIEDHAPSRIMLCEALRGAGWSIDAVSTGAGALKKARQTQYQAVICDLRLPDISAEKLVRELKGCTAGETPPLHLALTSDPRAESRRRTLAAGFDIVLEKPIRIRPLITALADAIIEREAADPHEAAFRISA